MADMEDISAILGLLSSGGEEKSANSENAGETDFSGILTLKC